METNLTIEHERGRNSHRWLDAGSLCWMLLALTVAITGCNRSQGKPPAPPPPEVTYGKPESQKVTDYEEFTGHTEARRAILVEAMVTGYLDKVLFKEGDIVAQDAPLFKIDPRIYQAQLDQAVANLDLAQAHLKRLESDLLRAKTLLPTKAIAQGDYDKAEGDRNEAAATVKKAEADERLARQNLDFTTITASIGGRVSRQMIDPGNMVKANETPLTRIVSLDRMYIYFDVDERTTIRIRRLIDEGRIPSAEHATLTIEYGLADETGFSHSANVNFVDNTIDMSTGTWRLRAVIEKPDTLLLPNMFLRVRVPIGKPYDALLIPERALGFDQGQKYLYVLDKDNKAVYKQVQCGLQCGPLPDGRAAILAGLQADERFVIDGLQRIRPGDVVTPKEAKPLEQKTAEQKTAQQKTAGTLEAVAQSPANDLAGKSDKPLSVARAPAAPAVAPEAEKRATAADNRAPNKQSSGPQPPVAKTPAADEHAPLARRS